MGSAAMCTGKQQFLDGHLAEKVARKMRRNNKTVRVYLCSACHKWHIGTPIGAIRR